MAVTLYSTGCPQCNVLKKKLDLAGIEYNTIEDPDAIADKGFMTAPLLEVEDKVMQFKEAVDWIATKDN